MRFWRQVAAMSAVLATAAGVAAAGGAWAQIPPDIAAQLKEIGPRIEAAKTTALYTAQLPKDMYAGTYASRDVAYGDDDKQKIDIFTAAKPTPGLKPVLVFVHGGGFSGGDKHRPATSPFYDNIMVWGAKNGLVGVNFNYRLAPKNTWPTGPEDLASAIKWLEANVAQYGGDPKRIYLWGHSVGAVHVADYVAHPQFHPAGGVGVKGVVLTSGQIYDMTGPNVTPAYYGTDASKYPEMASTPGLAKSKVPVLLTMAELDPEAFRAQSLGLKDALCKAGHCPKVVELKGHSHISETYAIGTSDTSLSGPVLAFVKGKK